MSARQLSPDECIGVVARAAAHVPLAVIADEYGVSVEQVKAAVDRARAARAASGRPQLPPPSTGAVNGTVRAAVIAAPVAKTGRTAAAEAAVTAVKKQLDTGDLYTIEELVDWGRTIGITRAATLAERVESAAGELRPMLARREEIDERKAEVAAAEEALRAARAALAQASGTRIPAAASRASASNGGSSTAAIRSWALEHGYDVKPRGLLPGHVIDAYNAVHP